MRSQSGKVPCTFTLFIYFGSSCAQDLLLTGLRRQYGVTVIKGKHLPSVLSLRERSIWIPNLDISHI